MKIKKTSQKGCLFVWRRWWDFRSLRSSDCFRQAKNPSPSAWIFGASGTHPVGSHPHQNRKRAPKRELFFYGGDGGISARFARRIASAKPKILRLLLGFLGRQVLTRWVLIHTKIEKELPKGNSFSMAEMVGFEPTCPVKDKTISSRSRYDHFDTSPCSVQQTMQRYRRGRLRMA